MLAAAFFSAAIVAVLTTLVWVEKINATQTISVFIAKGNIGAGSPYSDDTVQPASIRAGDGDFAYQKEGPRNVRARYATSLHPGDIIRQDDLVPFDQRVEIALTITASPTVAVGDTIDVYATLDGNSVLVGRRLTVVSPGPAVTVLVPAEQEAEWVAASASSAPFHAVRAVQAAAPPQGRAMSSDQALRQLCGSSCSPAGSGLRPGVP